MAHHMTQLVRSGTGLCLLLVLSGTARAEPEPAKPAAEAAKPSPDAVKEAGERYARGLTLYGDGEFLLALVEFERAYQLSQNYKVLYNIGQVRIQLGRYAKGQEALEDYLQRGGQEINAERKQAVNKDLVMLAERTATLQITANEEGAEISLDGKAVGTSPLSAPLVVDAGEHSLVLRKAGFYDQTQSVTLAGRERSDVKFELVPVAAVAAPLAVERPSESVPTKPAHTALWVGWSTTGALAVAAGLTGYFGATKANDLESMRTDYGVTRGQLDSAKNSARTLLTVSDIATGLAVVAGGVSLYLTLSSAKERPAEQRSGSAASRLAIGLGPTGVRFRAAF
jgi:tetratricopeptide (TPR) repeat protein